MWKQRAQGKRVEDEVSLFGSKLPAKLEDFLYDTNPWWRDKPMRTCASCLWLIHALWRYLSPRCY